MANGKDLAAKAIEDPTSSLWEERTNGVKVSSHLNYNQKSNS